MLAKLIASVLTIIGPKLFDFCVTLFNKFMKKKQQAAEAEQNNQEARNYEANPTDDNLNKLP